jgi:transposase
MAWRHLSDGQWEHVRRVLPPVKPSRKGGRPRADDRRCFEGILWILWTGAPWSELPRRYGSPRLLPIGFHGWQPGGTTGVAGPSRFLEGTS